LWTLTSCLGASRYGAWVAILAFCTSAANLGGGGFNVYLIQQGTRSHIRDHKIGRVFFATTLLSVIATVLLVPLIVMLCAEESEPLSYIWITVIAVATVLNICIRTGLQCAEAFRDYAIASFADRAIFSIFCIVIAVRCPEVSYAQLCTAHLVALMAPVIWAYCRLASDKLTLDLCDFRLTDCASIATPNTLAIGANYALSPAFFILAMASAGATPSMLGHVGLAFRLSGLLQQPLSWVAPTVFPALGRVRETEGYHGIRRVVTTIVIPIAWIAALAYIAICGLLFFTPVIPFIFTDAFDGSRLWLVILLAAIGGEVMNTILVKALWSLDQNVEILRCCLAACLPVLLVFLNTSDPYWRGIGFVLGIWCRTVCQCWYLGVKDKSAWGILAASMGMSMIIPCLLLFESSLAAHQRGFGILASVAAVFTAMMSGRITKAWRVEN